MFSKKKRGVKSPGDPSPCLKKGIKQTRVKSEAKRGSKESLQARVCEAVRRGLQWKRESQSGTKWPTAFRRFRRLLSGGPSHEADPQQEQEPVTSAMSTGDNPSSSSQPETVVDKGWPRSEEVVSGLVKHFETLRDDKPHDPGGKRQSPARQLSLNRQLSISVDESDGFASSTTGTTRSRSAVPSIVMELCESDDEREPKVPVTPAPRPPTLPMSSNVDSTTNLMRKSPVTVQEWVDSIPASPPVDNDPDDVLADIDHVAFADDICPTVTIRPADTSEVDGVSSETAAVQRRELFSREASPSLQSDTGSHTSSVDSFLDARRPDPEELLLSLGFGGSVSSDAELSRIPARFLQPSRVKGININDFLRYQQDIIDTFETGFCGYRGLTGGSQTPSGIVSKIMEKLREHERESSTKSSAPSTPAHAVGGRHRFTRAAQAVSLLSRLKTKEGEPTTKQTSSVLNADNRKFLENQSSKSPEVPRRRMILGQRSFTLDNKGDIIEYETTAEPAPEIADPLEMLTNQNKEVSKPQLPRPLKHKDSFVSSATSLSLTSADSDSDSDSDQPVVQRYLRSQSYQPVGSDKPASPTPLPNIDENKPTEARRKAPPLRRRSTSVDILETEGIRKRNVSGRDKGGAVSPARKALKQWQKSGSGSSLYDESAVTTPERTRSMTESPSSVSSLSSSEAFHGGATQRRRGSLKRQQNVVEEDEYLPMDAASGEGGEELGVGERQDKTLPDSEEFQDGRLDEPTAPLFRSPLTKQLSQSEPLLCSHSPECHPAPVVDNLKRLSLPVIQIWDELGPSLWRTKQCCDVILPTGRGIPRWQSLPSELSRVRRRDLSSPGSNSDSRSNMFSSCSDESVIHIQTTDLLVEENGDEGRRSPVSSQFNELLRVPLAWSVSPANGDSFEGGVNDSENQACELTDLINGNVPEPPTTVFKNMLSSLYQQDEVTAFMDGGDAADFSLGSLGNPPRCHASTQTENYCRCGEIYVSLLQENIRLQKVVAANSSELARVRKLLEAIIARGDIIKGDTT